MLFRSEFYWVKLSLFTRSRISGRCSEHNYEYGAVLQDRYRAESEDIQYNVDWEALREFDAKKGNVSHVLIDKATARLIALPRSTRSASASRR